MNIILIGTDETISQYLPESVFKIEYFRDVNSATRDMDYRKSDAVLLDMSGSNARDYELLKLHLRNTYVPVIVLGNGRKETGDTIVMQSDTDTYLPRHKLNSSDLSRVVIDAGITKEIRRKLNKIDLFHQLKAHNDPFELLFQNSPLGTFLLGPEKRVLYLNKYMEEMLHCRKQGVFNHYITQYLYPDDIPVYLEKTRNLGPDNRNTVFECRFLGGEKDPAWWRLYVSYLAVPGKNEGCYLVTAMDISQEKQNRELLVKAKKSAEDANNTKTEFLSNMSHEIRTPIHTIVGMTELLLDTSLNNPQKKYVNRIRFSLDALLNLVNHILDLSKMEAGNLHIQDLDFNLHRLLEQSIDLVSSQVHKKKLELSLFIGEGVPELLKGDSQHLQQIIRHLLNNAIKFTEKGEISVAVTRISTTGNQVKLRFSIKDTGSGIEEDRLSTIFQPFAQPSGNCNCQGGGTGVGLSIVKKLVEHMQGEINVSSQWGEGSNFHFELTFQVHSDILPEGAPVQPLAGRNILLIGGSPATRQVLYRYIKEWGGTPREVEFEHFANSLDRTSVEKQYGQFELGILDLNPAVADRLLELLPKLQPSRYLLLRPVGSLVHQAGALTSMGFPHCIVKPLRKRNLLASLREHYLPETKRETEEPVAREAQKTDNTCREDIPENRQQRILVVEDHEVNREFFCTILNKMGFKVRHATDGVEAVRMSELYTFDLIFMDIQMPGMNGYDVTRILREKGIKIPIIAVTANTVRGEISRCLHAGMNDYMAKPFKRSDLIPLLNKWLENDLRQGDYKETVKREDTLCVFDFEKAVEMFMGQKAVVLRLLAPFLQRLEEQLKNMQEARTKGDYLTIQHEAHTIKGGALNIQAIELGTSALELEKAARKGEAEQVVARSTALEDAYQHFRDAVHTVLKENQASA